MNTGTGANKLATFQLGKKVNPSSNFILDCESSPSPNCQKKMRTSDCDNVIFRSRDDLDQKAAGPTLNNNFMRRDAMAAENEDSDSDEV